MNNQGDGSKGYFGVGAEAAPSQTFSSEPVTGVYLDTPGAGSAYTITKRGRKRIRVDDTKTTFYDPVVFGGGTSSSSISFPDGSETAPSITFTSHTTSGMYFDGTVLGPGMSAGGGKIQTWDTTKTATTVPILTPSGSSVAPGLCFGDVKTGWSADLANSRATLSTNATTRFTVDPTGVNTLPLPITTASISCSSISASGTLTSSLVSTPAIKVGTLSTGLGASSDSKSLFLYANGTNMMTLNTTELFNNGGFNGSYLIAGPVTSTALTSTSFSNSGTSTLTGLTTCNTVRSVVGSSGTPSYSWTSQTNSGMYYGSGPSISKGGTTQVVFDGTTAGFTVDVTYPRYYLRLYTNANQSIPNATTNPNGTGIPWDTVESSGNSNFTFTPTASLITIPKSGMYEVIYNVIWTASASGARATWIEINPAGGVPAGGRRYGECDTDNTSSIPITQGKSALLRFTAGDTFLIAGVQTTAGALNVMGLTGSGGGLQACTMSVERLYE